MAERPEILTVGEKVWAEWFENCFYRGTILGISLSASIVTVKFDDDDISVYNAAQYKSIVIDREMTEDEAQKLKEGDNLLVKMRGSKRMQKGVLEKKGRAFYTIKLAGIEGRKERRRPSGLRVFRQFIVKDTICATSPDNDVVEVKKEEVGLLDQSVQIVDIVTCTDLLGRTIAENGNLPKVTLSPEVLWGRKNLIDFPSPSETNTSVSCSLGGLPLHQQTIGLSLDPLNRLREPVLQASTPVSNLSDSNTTFDFSSSEVSTIDHCL